MSGPAKSSAVFLSPLPSLPAFSAVTTARTPGAAFAAVRSMDAMRPFGMADPTTAVGRVQKIPLIGIDGAARGLERTVDPIERFADHFELVDRVGCGRRVELHGSAFRLG